MSNNLMPFGKLAKKSLQKGKRPRERIGSFDRATAFTAPSAEGMKRWARLEERLRRLEERKGRFLALYHQIVDDLGFDPDMVTDDAIRTKLRGEPGVKQQSGGHQF